LRSRINPDASYRQQIQSETEPATTIHYTGWYRTGTGAQSLSRGELGDGLGPLRDGVLGELAGED
jgi:hypothetical protein